MLSEDELLAFSMNKRKALETAQKYVQKGQYDKALKEYQKHLQTDPEDTNARLKVGDLQLKLNNPQAAIEAYGQVAHQFSRSGFDAKAVAIYKQILKVDAQSLDARVKLGEHFQRMGLGTEALRELQEAVNICQERGLKRESFNLLKRVAELDPDNLPNRLSLADLLVRESLLDEAQDEFARLLEKVEKDGAADQIVRVSEQMLAHFPDAEAALIAFATAKVKVGMAADAIARVNEMLPRFVESIALREALVAAYDAVGDTGKKRAIYREIAELFKRRGNDDKAREILQRFVPIEGLGGDPETQREALSIADLSGSGLLDFTSEGIGSDTPPEPLAPQRLSPTSAAHSIPPAETTPEGTYEELVAQAKVELDFGDPDTARRYAERAAELEPNATTARDILRSVAGDADPDDDDEPGTLPDIELVLVNDLDDEDEFASVDPPLEVEMQLHQPPPRRLAEPSTPATPVRVEESDSSEEIEIDLDDLDLASADVGELEPVDDGRHLVEPDVEPPTQSGASASWAQQSTWVGKTIAAAEAIYSKGLLEEAKMLYEQVLEHAPHHPQAMVRLGEIAATLNGPEASEANIDFELSFADTQIDRPAVELEPPAAPKTSKAPKATPISLRDERAGQDSIDELLNAVADDIGAASPEARGPRIELPDDFAPEDAADDGVDFDDLMAGDADLSESEPEDSVEFVIDVPEPDDAGLVDFASELGSELEAEALALERETSARAKKSEAQLGDTLKERGAARVPSAFDDDDIVAIDDETPIGVDAGVDDAAIEDLLGQFPDDAVAVEEPEEDGFDLAAELEEGHGLHAEPEFSDVLRAFKKGIEQQVSAEDAAAHYDLAIAYKEMGLFDEAVEALEKVQKNGPLGVEGMSLLATCKLEQGKPEEAAILLTTALQRAASSSEKVALGYDLGLAHAAAGRRDDALRELRKVAEQDPSFREVQEHIAELSN